MLVAAAVAACAWLAVGLRSSRLLADGERAFGNAGVSKAEIDHRRGLLGDARDLNPDRTPAIREAQLLITSNRDRQAVSVIREVVEHEPENYEAWLALRQAAVRVDPQLSRRATETALRLNPLARRSAREER